MAAAKNQGTDKLVYGNAADLHLCFSLMQKADFLMTR